MSSSQPPLSAEEAVARARAIAAKLAGESVAGTMNAAPPAASASTPPEASSTTSGSKRKRWGVAAPDNQDEDDDPKRMKESDKKLQRRIWVKSSTAERPYAHFGVYLKRHLPDRLDRVKKEHAQERLFFELAGKGSSDQPPIPGMPEEPLSVLLYAPQSESSEVALDALQGAVDELLQEATTAPLEVAVDPESTGGPRDAHAGALQAYRPASVATLIHNQSQYGATGGNSGPLLTDVIGVPTGVVGYIIGRGGENITSMQQQTGCKVQIQKEFEVPHGQTERQITLEAHSQAALDTVKEMINSMVQERIQSMGGSQYNGGSGGVHPKDAKVQEAIQQGHTHVTLAVPDADVGLVIGKMGATIRSIQDETGASIQVPTESNGGGMRTVHITHPHPGGAAAAQERIQSLLQSRPSFAHGGSGQQQQAREPQTTLQVMIPDSDVGLCIGRQGCVIRQMQSMTGTRIQIPSHALPGESHRVASVSGPAAGCEQVRQFVERISAEQSSACVMSGQPFSQGYANGGGGGHPQQQQQDNSQYSAEWAAYHAAQAAAASQGSYAAAPAAYAAPAPAAYSAPAPAAYAAPAPAAYAAPAPATSSSTEYHEQFFRYAYYYGEDAARQYYGAWSPAPGTPNPYGTNPNGITAAPEAAPVAQAPQPAPAPRAPQPAPRASQPTPAAVDTSRRKVSNLPAWMTKGS